MKKVFIDLGAFTGDTIELALKSGADFDVFYAVEPLKSNFEHLYTRFGTHPKVVLMNCAADAYSGHATFYKGNLQFGAEAGSLVNRMLGTSPDETESVRVLDTAEFIVNTFALDDRIVLKLDIEGKEYDVLNRLISENVIGRISEIYCEWHYGRFGMSADDHFRFIKRLRRLGFDLTGNNDYDEYKFVHDWGNMRLKLTRNAWHYLYRSYRAVKPMLPDTVLRALREITIPPVLARSRQIALTANFFEPT